MTHNGQTEEAGREFRQALALSPSLYEANLYYGRFLFAQGRFQEAVQFFKRAAEIRPDDYFSPIHLMGCYFSLGVEDERQRWARIGIERAKTALERHPENASPAHRGALALAHMGEGERAKEWVTRALAIDPDDVVAQYNAACVYSLLGESERALDLLETVVPQSSSYHLQWFEQDSDLNAIRDHPRFRALLQTMGGYDARTR
ncbi:Tfp pilus assembly protein PilF [Sinorhizobium fredii]